MRVILSVTLALAWLSPAEAAHCRHGQIYRVSMGVCVSAHSRLARVSHRRHIPVRLPPRQAIQRARKADRLAPAPDPTPEAALAVLGLPWTIPGSVMMGRPVPTWRLSP
jgi:hypothetical protein